MRRTWHFFAFNLSPEMFVNLSSILIKFSKDLFDPSNIKDAPSAKRDVLFSFPSMYIPFISGLFLTWFDSSSMQIINKYGTRGSSVSQHAICGKNQNGDHCL